MIRSKLFRTERPDWAWNALTKIFEDTLLLANQLRTDIYGRVQKCRRLEELLNLHNELTKAVNNIDLLLMPEIKFQKPPIKGTKNIIPIKNLYELASEGQKQKHVAQT